MQVWNTVTSQQVVAGTVQMVCVQRDLALCALPRETIEGLLVNYPPPPAPLPAPPRTPPPPATAAAASSPEAAADASRKQQIKLQLKQLKQQQAAKQQLLLATPAHEFEVEVFYEDTDFTGVVCVRARRFLRARLFCCRFVCCPRSVLRRDGIHWVDGAHHTRTRK
jgi:acyl-CoA thioesterase FadM